MANTMPLDELENISNENVITFNTDYAFNLLRTSAYNDEQKYSIDSELNDEIEIGRLNEIIHNLKMNQSETPNPGMTEIKQQLNERLKRDGD